MNMEDYLRWRGDLTFDKEPFNLVDNLLCCYIAYTDLKDIVPSGKNGITLKEASDIFFSLHTEEEVRKNRSFIAKSPFVLKEMAKTERFKNAKLLYYVDDIDKETTLQFCALRIDLTRTLSFVSYCGTDDTLIGWKEDCQLSYKETNAQKQAVEFLEKVTTPLFRRYYVGGHSKGGNLAIYASTNCNRSTQKKIIKIFNNDGPGLSEELYDKTKYDAIKDRIIRIVPEFSIFGQLFAQDCQEIYVKSDQRLSMQHDATSWQVLGNDFERADGLDETSYQLKKELENFFKNVNNQQREVFTNELFNAFDEAGLKTVSDFANEGLPATIKVIKKVSSINEQAKEVLSEMLKILIDISNKKISQFGKEKSRDFKDMLSDAREGIEKFVDKACKIVKNED